MTVLRCKPLEVSIQKIILIHQTWIRLSLYNVNYVTRNLNQDFILKSEAKKQDTLKNCPSVRNPQFLSYHYETW